MGHFPETTATMPDPIEALIVRLCRRVDSTDGARIDIESLRGPGAAGRFLERSGKLGVRGLVLKTLRAAGPVGIERDPALAPLMAPLALLRKQAALWELEMERILGALGPSGPHPLVLKGGALRHVAYDDPIERWMGDLDLLVRPHEVGPFMDALTALGYSSGYPAGAAPEIEAHHYHHLVTHASGFIVEVHLGLTRPGAACSLDAAGFLDRAREHRTRGGAPILVPAPEDLLLHQVSQLEQDGCRRLSRLVDIDRIVASSPGLNWPEVEARAAEGNLTIPLALALRLGNLLFSTPVPERWREGRPLSRMTRAAVALQDPVSRLLREDSVGSVASDDLLRLWLLPTWRLRRGRLKEIASRRSDPLQWIWEGKEDPQDGELSRTGGPIRVLKLLAYQGWVLATGLIRWVRDRVGGGGSSFWALARPQSTREAAR